MLMPSLAEARSGLAGAVNGGGLTFGYAGSSTTGGSPPPPSYTGPGDVVSSASIWYGLRAYNAAYAAATGNIAIFRRSSDNATCTGIASATTGGLDLTTTYCSGTTNLPTFCGNSGGNCFVSTLYDQSGANRCSAAACNVVQATTGDQPRLVFNCINTSLPCLQFVKATPTYLQSSGSLTAQGQPFTFSFVAEATSSTDDVLSAGVQSGWNNTNLGFIFSGGFATATASFSAFHAIQGVFNGASSSLNVDGTLTSSLNAGGTSASGTIGVGTISGSNVLDGFILEAGMWPGAVSTTNQGLMCHNQFSYWGTSTSC
jgi:hypothetical protein